MAIRIMYTIITIFILMLPATLLAATNCRIVDLPDRYEAICEGDERSAAETYNLSSQKLQPRKPQTVTAVQNPKQQTNVHSGQVNDNPREMSAAVKQLIAYRQNKLLQRSDVEAKRAVRMEMIRAGR